MRNRFALAALVAAILFIGYAVAADRTDPLTDQKSTDGSLWTYPKYLLSGEDQTTNRLMTMPRYTSSAIKTTDALVSTGTGTLHTISCASDAAATAGSMSVFDNTAESGTVIFTKTFGTANYDFSMILDVAVTTGIYIGFTTTADVGCVISYLDDA